MSLAMLAGCVDAVDDDQPQTDPIGKIAANSLVPADIHVSSLGLAALTPAALTASGLLDTLSGRNYMGYLSGCALGSTQSIAAPQSVTPYYLWTYRGSYGLAPGWTTGALSSAERHWVSACILARSNYFGTTVTISIDGINNAVLGTGDTGYGIEEGAFFGDILAGGSGQMGACIGVDQAHDPSQGDLPKRVCAAGASWCNFTNYGNCNATCTTTTFPYGGCGASGSQITEVIGVRLSGVPD